MKTFQKRKCFKSICWIENCMKNTRNMIVLEMWLKIYLLGVWFKIALVVFILHLVVGDIFGFFNPIWVFVGTICLTIIFIRCFMMCRRLLLKFLMKNYKAMWLMLETNIGKKYVIESVWEWWFEFNSYDFSEMWIYFDSFWS